jgi:hypothetical protein
VSFTLAFAANFAVQVVGQLIPRGLLVTVPSPAAERLTVNWKDPGGGGVPILLLPPQALITKRRIGSEHARARYKAHL